MATQLADLQPALENGSRPASITPSSNSAFQVPSKTAVSLEPAKLFAAEEPVKALVALEPVRAWANVPLSDVDPQVWGLIEKEKERQWRGIELIASENFVSQAVLEALGSPLTNKYSEGYPGARYYGGNHFIDEIEDLCRQRALAAFHLDPTHWGVNVQPYSCTSANFAVFTGLLQPKERIMGLDLPSGGHLSHGYCTGSGKKVSATSIFFDSMPYRVDPVTGLLDYEKIEERAMDYRPKILVCGGSAYPREWDFGRFRKIADKCGAILMCDMAHISMLVAAEEHPSPFDHVDIVTSTTHKGLRGPRGGIIFYRKGPKQHQHQQQQLRSASSPPPSSSSPALPPPSPSPAFPSPSPSPAFPSPSPSPALAPSPTLVPLLPAAGRCSTPPGGATAASGGGREEQRGHMKDGDQEGGAAGPAPVDQQQEEKAVKVKVEAQEVQQQAQNGSLCGRQATVKRESSSPPCCCCGGGAGAGCGGAVEKYDYEERISFALFPSLQGGPQNAHIAALAVAFKQVATPGYKAYIQQVKRNATALSTALIRRGCRLVTNGTDNHLLLWDLRPLGITGLHFERVCEQCHITLNKNAVYGDSSSPLPGGVRIGTPAMTSRGCLEGDMDTIADFLVLAVQIAQRLLRQLPVKRTRDFVDRLHCSTEIAELRRSVSIFASKLEMPGFEVPLSRGAVVKEEAEL